MSLRDRYEEARKRNVAKFEADKARNENHGRPGWGCSIFLVIGTVAALIYGLSVA